MSDKKKTIDKTPARLDADKTAQPKSRIVSHVDREACFGPGTIGKDPEYRNDRGESIPLEPELCPECPEAQRKGIACVCGMPMRGYGSFASRCESRCFDRQCQEQQHDATIQHHSGALSWQEPGLPGEPCAVAMMRGMRGVFANHYDGEWHREQNDRESIPAQRPLTPELQSRYDRIAAEAGPVLRPVESYYEGDDPDDDRCEHGNPITSDCAACDYNRRHEAKNSEYGPTIQKPIGSRMGFTGGPEGYTPTVEVIQSNHHRAKHGDRMLSIDTKNSGAAKVSLETLLEIIRWAAAP